MVINTEKWKYLKIILFFIFFYLPTSEILNQEKKIVEIEFFFCPPTLDFRQKSLQTKNKKEGALISTHETKNYNHLVYMNMLWYTWKQKNILKHKKNNLKVIKR